MENPARTAQYLAERDARLAALRAELAQHHPPVPPAPAARAVSAKPLALTLEIGCGHGHYLNAYAAAHPAATCVGIDLLKDRIARCKKKCDRARLPNLHFYATEALEFLACLPPAITFADIFILFPDPWPKRRHHKNRILQPAFLDQLADRAAPTARLCFRTDYEPYFADALATVRAHPRWQLLADSVATPTDLAALWPFEQETVFQSRAAAGHHSLVAKPRAPR